MRSPALYSEANEEVHQHALVGSETQDQVAGILDKVLKANPGHPGALHYSIHNYDDPEHARLALPAARRYAKAAPDSSHALHMPAHVFVQLGNWAEAAATDEASFAQSIRWVKQRGFRIGMRDYHSLSWLCYEVLQQGRFRRARETLELIRAGVADTGAQRLKAIESAMRAQYVIDARAWEMLRASDRLQHRRGVVRDRHERRGDGAPQVAALALNELKRRSQGGKLDAAVMEKELAATLELRQGRKDRAVTLAEEAVAIEKKLSAPARSPPAGETIPGTLWRGSPGSGPGPGRRPGLRARPRPLAKPLGLPAGAGPRLGGRGRPVGRAKELPSTPFELEPRGCRK